MITRRSTCQYWLPALAAIAAFCGLARAQNQAPPPGAQPPTQSGVQVLTRGPMHEAFAEAIVSEPAPGIVVPKIAPALIEEVPPDVRPEGANITWIPGYWAWDDDQSDFIWISGVWRDIPPGRQWVPGYWLTVQGGCQWTAGYWADARVREVEYLPAPPATLELGPSVAAASVDQVWIPGCWIWVTSHYAWQPGYWTVARPDWVWTPPHYVCAPRGYVHVSGYWDRPILRRGVCYAPVTFEPAVFARASFTFAPSFVLDLNVCLDHLFLRPRYCHYYFGDYYDTRYYDSGIYASFTYFSSDHHRDRIHFYDPIYAHHRWEHRHDRDWEARIEHDFAYRRDHHEARPPHTLIEQARVTTAEGGASRGASFALATTVEKLEKQGSRPMRLRATAQKEKARFGEKGSDLQKYRETRRSMDAPTVAPSAKGDSPRERRADRAKMPRSPIMGKPSADLRKGESPPKPPRAPKPDAKLNPDLSPGKERGGPARNEEPKPEGGPPPKARTESGASRPGPEKGKAQPGPKVQPRKEPSRDQPSVEQGNPGKAGPNKEGGSKGGPSKRATGKSRGK